MIMITHELRMQLAYALEQNAEVRAVYEKKRIATNASVE